MSLLFKFTLEYTIRRVQVNKKGLKLNSTHQLLVYADDIKILGESLHTIKKNTKALVVASKEIVLEVNVENSKHMDTCQAQNAGQYHKVKTDNKSFKRVEQFKYLGTTLTKQIPFRKKSRAE